MEASRVHMRTDTIGQGFILGQLGAMEGLKQG